MLVETLVEVLKKKWLVCNNKNVRRKEKHINKSVEKKDVNKKCYKRKSVNKKIVPLYFTLNKTIE